MGIYKHYYAYYDSQEKTTNEHWEKNWLELTNFSGYINSIAVCVQILFWNRPWNNIFWKVNVLTPW